MRKLMTTTTLALLLGVSSLALSACDQSNNGDRTAPKTAPDKPAQKMPNKFKQKQPNKDMLDSGNKAPKKAEGLVLRLKSPWFVVSPSAGTGLHG